MSDITLFQSGNLVAPDYLSGSIDETTKDLIGFSSIKRISIRNGAFHVLSGGKDVLTSEESSLKVVIVRVAPKNSRTYYEGQYEEGSNAPPDCWSNDGETPDKNCTNRQSNACATCRQNEAGSGTRENTRACRFNRRIAVVLEDQILTTGEIFQMIIPATSLFGEGEKGKMTLQQYAGFLEKNGVGVTAVVTEMKFDRSGSNPKLVFRADRYVKKEEYDQIMQFKDHPTAIAAMAYEPPTARPSEKTVKPEIFTPTPPPDYKPNPPAPARPRPRPEPKLEEAPVVETPVVEVPVAAEPEVVEEPTVRSQKAPTTRAVPSVASILDDWATDDEDE
jgi:hypothetical protein